MNLAFKKIKHQLNDQRILKEAFYKIRDEIYSKAKTCADNIKVTIKFSGSSVEPLVITVGKGENTLDININRDGTSSYQWKQTTWLSWGWGFYEGVKSLATGVVETVGSTFSSVSNTVYAITGRSSDK